MTYHGESDEEDTNSKAKISDDSKLDNSEVLGQRESDSLVWMFHAVPMHFKCVDVIAEECAHKDSDTGGSRCVIGLLRAGGR